MVAPSPVKIFAQFHYDYDVKTFQIISRSSNCIWLCRHLIWHPTLLQVCPCRHAGINRLLIEQHRTQPSDPSMGADCFVAAGVDEEGGSFCKLERPIGKIFSGAKPGWSQQTISAQHLPSRICRLISAPEHLSYGSQNALFINSINLLSPFLCCQCKAQNSEDPAISKVLSP